MFILSKFIEASRLLLTAKALVFWCRFVMTTPYIVTNTVADAHSSDIFGLATTPRATLSASGDGRVLSWDHRTMEKHELTTEPVKAGIHHLCTDNVGEWAAAMSFDGVPLLWNLREQKQVELKSISQIRGGWACALAAEQPILAVATLKGLLYVVDLREDKLLQELTPGGEPGPCTCIDISANGELVVAGYDSGKARVFSCDTGRIAYTFPAPAESLRAIKFSPLATTVALAAETNIALYAVNGGSFMATLPGHVGSIYSLDFDQSGSRLLSVAGDGQARIWSVEDRQCVCTLRDAEGPLFAGAWLPTSAITGARIGIVTAGYDRELRLYREASGASIEPQAVS